MKRIFIILFLLLFATAVFAMPPFPRGSDSMTYPGSGIAKSTGSGWDTSIGIGTLTNTKWCIYTTAAGIVCNSDTPAGGSVATDTIFDAAGDLVQGTGADASAKLTKGAAGTILRAGATSNAYSTSTFADTYVIGSLLHAATANTIAALAPGAVGSFLMSNGSAAALSYLAPGADTYILLGKGVTTVPVWSTPAQIKTALGYLDSANISNTAYDATTWDAVTTIAPTKNAIRDYLESKMPAGTDGTHGLGITNNTSAFTPTTGDWFTFIADVPYFIIGATQTRIQAYSAKLAAIAALANGAGVLTNDGSGNFSYGAGGGSPGGSVGDIQWNNTTFAGGGPTWDNTAKTISTPQTTIPDSFLLRPGSGATNPTYYRGFSGATQPVTGYTKYIFPNADPTAGQVMGFGAVSSNASQITWITPLTSASIAATISDADTTHAPDGNSVFDALAGKAANNADTTGLTAANVPAPTTIVGSGSISVTTKNTYVICTSTCAVTLPVAAAGIQAYIRNAPGSATVITLVNRASQYYELTTHAAWATANQKLVSSGAATDSISVVGYDATHYATMNYTNAWTDTAP